MSDSSDQVWIETSPLAYEIAREAGITPHISRFYVPKGYSLKEKFDTIEPKYKEWKQKLGEEVRQLHDVNEWIFENEAWIGFENVKAGLNRTMARNLTS